jgi:hypothetical protein
VLGAAAVGVLGGAGGSLFGAGFVVGAFGGSAAIARAEERRRKSEPSKALSRGARII